MLTKSVFMEFHSINAAVESLRYMRVVGIIAEYNPLHNGHIYHLERARALSGADYCVVVMSGNFVQRGEAACTDKYTRAAWALKGGADVVLHSATKYISGHGDVVGGVATSKDFDYIQKLKFGYMCELGGVISPFSAWLLLRGMKTLGLRMERHERNATAIAEFLRKRKEIEKTSYPGFEDHPGHKLAARQMEGFGGIISFELCGPKENAEKFVQGLKLIKLAVSLGDAETLVEVPAMMTHRDYPEEELHRFGFSSKTVRISAGLEHHSDLLEDIEDALEKVYK